MVDLDLLRSSRNTDNQRQEKKRKKKMMDSKAGSGWNGQERNQKRPANTIGKIREFPTIGLGAVQLTPSLGPAQITKPKIFYCSTLGSTTTTSSQMPPRITWRSLEGLRQ